jgi:hypothetical protein
MGKQMALAEQTKKVTIVMVPRALRKIRLSKLRVRILSAYQPGSIFDMPTVVITDVWLYENYTYDLGEPLGHAIRMAGAGRDYQGMSSLIPKHTSGNQSE